MLRASPLVAALLILVACGGETDSAADGDTLVAPAEPTADVYRGTLEAGDDTLVSGEYLESYEVLAREGQWIRAEVISGDFDPYLLVLSPTKEQTDVDDSAAGNTSMTRAILEATEAGEWRVIVTSFAPGETGGFEMTIEVTDAKPADADEGVQASPDDLPTDSTTNV